MENKLDLHGIRHADVPKIVDSFLYDHMKFGSYEVSIITGYSNEMKSIVMELCEDYGFFVNPSWINSGILIISIR